MTTPSSSFRRRLRARRLLASLALVVILVVAFAVLFPPWIFHIGDRSTPGMSWDGVGTVTATNGGTYVLSAHLIGGLTGIDRRGGMSCSQFSGCDSVHGTARLCTRSGHSYTFKLLGAVHSWWSTDSARTNVDLTGTSLPDGWVVALTGAWKGPTLVLHSPDNSFTEAFTPAGVVRTTTSTADAGTATVSLRYGTAADFTRACTALAAG